MKGEKGAEEFLRRRASGVSRMVVDEFLTTEIVSIHFEQKDTKETKNAKGEGKEFKERREQRASRERSERS